MKWNKGYLDALTRYYSCWLYSMARDIGETIIFDYESRIQQEIDCHKMIPTERFSREFQIELRELYDKYVLSVLLLRITMDAMRPTCSITNFSDEFLQEYSDQYRVCRGLTDKLKFPHLHRGNNSLVSNYHHLLFK